MTVYDEEYFLRGRESGKSLYDNYRWLPDLTIPMVKAIVRHCDIRDHHSVLDFGAARGYIVKAFRQLGYDCYGIDASEWAVQNCDPEIAVAMKCTSVLPPDMHWILAKDVLEHVANVQEVVSEMLDKARVGIFAVVPLSAIDGGPYIVPDYELDVTHVHRLTLATWTRMFIRHGWSVECAYRVRGVKDNYHGWLAWVRDDFEKWRQGNGFIVARRML